jgi:aspartate aminotransferase-like enzyme
VSSDHADCAPLPPILEAIDLYRPKLLTIVHCDTPTGLLNKLDGIGSALHRHGGLLYVDFVSSVGGCPINTFPDEYEIDLGLAGSQKALSCPPDMAAVSISSRAWSVIEQVRYQGYDALLPFRAAVAQREFPYTHNWNGIAALNAAMSAIFTEGLDAVFQRHASCAARCRARLQAAGLVVFTTPAASAATVTAVLVSHASA